MNSAEKKPTSYGFASIVINGFVNPAPKRRNGLYVFVKSAEKSRRRKNYETEKENGGEIMTGVKCEGCKFNHGKYKRHGKRSSGRRICGWYPTKGNKEKGDYPSCFKKIGER